MDDQFEIQKVNRAQRNEKINVHNERKQYTYLTNFDVKPGDFAVVPVGEGFKVVRTVKILSNQIDPNDEMIYKWIVHIFDMEKYDV